MNRYEWRNEWMNEWMTFDSCCQTKFSFDNNCQKEIWSHLFRSCIPIYLPICTRTDAIRWSTVGGNVVPTIGSYKWWDTAMAIMTICWLVLRKKDWREGRRTRENLGNGRRELLIKLRSTMRERQNSLKVKLNSVV